MKITQCEKKIISGLFYNLWDTKNHANYSWNMESSRNILCLLSKESYSMRMKWNRDKHKHDSKSWCPFYIYPFQADIEHLGRPICIIVIKKIKIQYFTIILYLGIMQRIKWEIKSY